MGLADRGARADPASKFGIVSRSLRGARVRVGLVVVLVRALLALVAGPAGKLLLHD